MNIEEIAEMERKSVKFLLEIQKGNIIFDCLRSFDKNVDLDKISREISFGELIEVGDSKLEIF